MVDKFWMTLYSQATPLLLSHSRHSPPLAPDRLAGVQNRQHLKQLASTQPPERAFTSHHRHLLLLLLSCTTLTDQLALMCGGWLCPPFLFSRLSLSFLQTRLLKNTHLHIKFTQLWVNSFHVSLVPSILLLSAFTDFATLQFLWELDKKIKSPVLCLSSSKPQSMMPDVCS